MVNLLLGCELFYERVCNVDALRALLFDTLPGVVGNFASRWIVFTCGQCPFRGFLRFVPKAFALIGVGGNEDEDSTKDGDESKNRHCYVFRSRGPLRGARSGALLTAWRMV